MVEEEETCTSLNVAHSSSDNAWNYVVGTGNSFGQNPNTKRGFKAKRLIKSITERECMHFIALPRTEIIGVWTVLINWFLDSDYKEKRAMTQQFILNSKMPYENWLHSTKSKM